MGYPHFGDEYFTIIYEGEVPDMNKERPFISKSRSFRLPPSIAEWPLPV